MSPKVFRACAARLLANGFSPVPLRAGSKLPLLKRWDELRNNPLSESWVAEIAAKHADLGLAVAGGWNGLVPIDVDAEEVANAVAAALPTPLVVKVGRKGWTAFYRFETCAPVGGRKFQTAAPEMRPLCDVLATGLSAIPPTRHPETGQQYRWVTPRTFWDTHVAELPVITPEDIAHLAANLASLLPPPRIYVPAPRSIEAPSSERRMAAYARAVLQGQVKLLSGMAGGRNNALYRAVCTLGKFVHHQMLSEAELRDALISACQANGSVRDHGQRQCHDTIASGLKRSSRDPLSPLPDRRAA